MSHNRSQAEHGSAPQVGWYIKLAAGKSASDVYDDPSIWSKSIFCFSLLESSLTQALLGFEMIAQLFLNKANRRAFKKAPAISNKCFLPAIDHPPPTFNATGGMGLFWYSVQVPLLRESILNTLTHPHAWVKRGVKVWGKVKMKSWGRVEEEFGQIMPAPSSLNLSHEAL